jgi:hypothetical protein
VRERVRTFFSESSGARAGLERRAFWGGVSSAGCSAGLFPDVVARDDDAASAGGGGEADLGGIAGSHKHKRGRLRLRETGEDQKWRWADGMRRRGEFLLKT